LDYFLARYYSGVQGRFTSPDEFKGGPDDALTGAELAPPGPLPYADITNPQTLNKYAYVINNPLRYTDPDGHTWAEFFGGVADTTYRPIVQAVSHPIDTVGNMASSLAHPIDTVSAISNSVVATSRGALAGDSRSLGEVTGTVVSALVTAGAAKGVSALAKAMPVQVTHFTSLEGQAAISASGNLRAGSFVTKAGQVAGKTATQVENVLDIQPGKGQFSITATTTRGNLAVPANGKVVPGGQNGGIGGAWQRQLKTSVPIDPQKFKRIPE
jgi:RHS repeat-associated protein